MEDGVAIEGGVIDGDGICEVALEDVDAEGLEVWVGLSAEDANVVTVI